MTGRTSVPKQQEKTAALESVRSEYDVIIVGGGPAGMTAAVGAAQNGMRVALVEKAVLGGCIGAIGIVQNYLGTTGRISGMELARNMARQVRESRIDLIWTEVASVSVIDSHVFAKLALEDRVITAPYAIVATGLSPKHLGVPGEERLFGLGVSYYAMADIASYRGKTVAVIGGGNYALTQASYLEQVASKIIIVYRYPELKAFSVLRKRVETNPIYEIHTNAFVEEIIGERHVEGVRIHDHTTGLYEDIPVDAAIICVGMFPKTQILKDSVQLDEKGFVLTDDSMLSSNPCIYCAGDIRAKMIRQIVTASSDGLTAAKAIYERRA